VAREGRSIAFQQWGSGDCRLVQTNAAAGKPRPYLGECAQPRRALRAGAQCQMVMYDQLGQGLSDPGCLLFVGAQRVARGMARVVSGGDCEPDLTRRRSPEGVGAHARAGVRQALCDYVRAWGMCLLLGLFLLVWPRWPAKGNPSIWRIDALVVVGLAFLIEVWWSVARLYNARQELKRSGKQMLRPTPQPNVEAIALDASSATELAAVLDLDRRRAANLGYPDLSSSPNADRR
jgi:hypothetical protein